MTGYRPRRSVRALPRRPGGWLPRRRVAEVRDGGPPEETYGRVTDPERFAILHDAAARLVDELVATYDITVEEGAHLLPDEEGWSAPRRVVRLTPSDPRAATVTITFTDFPGVRLDAGHSVAHLVPMCGCDACDDDPADEAERVEQELRDVVAGFVERIPGPPPRRRWPMGGRHAASDGDLPADDVTWAPWPRRG